MTARKFIVMKCNITAVSNSYQNMLYSKISIHPVLALACNHPKRKNKTNIFGFHVEYLLNDLGQQH
jgi:hypothetical protein